MGENFTMVRLKQHEYHICKPGLGWYVYKRNCAPLTNDRVGLFSSVDLSQDGLALSAYNHNLLESVIPGNYVVCSPCGDMLQCSFSELESLFVLLDGTRLTPEFFNIEAGKNIPWVTTRLAIPDGYAGVMYVPGNMMVRVNGVVLPRCIGNWVDSGVCIVTLLASINSARVMKLDPSRLDVSIGSMFYMPCETFAAVFDSPLKVMPRDFKFRQTALIAGVDLGSLWIYLNFVVSNARPYRTRQDDSYMRSEGVMLSSASDVIVMYNNASKFVAAATVYNGRYLVRFHIGTDFRCDFYNCVTAGFSSWCDLYTKYQSYVQMQADNTWYQKEYFSVYEAASGMSEFCGYVPKNILSAFTNISLTMQYSNALTVYTGDGYRPINNGMRIHNVPATYKQYCLDILICLSVNSLYTSSKLILWRGVPFIKDIFLDDAFVSTSMVPSVALGFSGHGMVLRIAEMFVVPSYDGVFSPDVVAAFEDTTRLMPRNMYTGGTVSALYLNEISGFRSNTEFEVLINARCRFELIGQLASLGGTPVYNARLIQMEQFEVYMPKEIVELGKAIGRLFSKSCYLASNITYTFLKGDDAWVVVFKDQANKEYYFRSYPNRTEQFMGNALLWHTDNYIDSVDVAGQLERETEEVRLLGVVTDRAVFCTFYNEILARLCEFSFMITDSDFWVMPAPKNEQMECRFVFKYRAPATDSYLLGVVVTTSYEGYTVIITQKDVMQDFEGYDSSLQTFDTNKIIAGVIKYALKIFKQDLNLRLEYVMSTLRFPTGCLKKIDDRKFALGKMIVMWDFRASPGAVWVSVNGMGKEFDMMTQDMAHIINFIFGMYRRCQ